MSADNYFLIRKHPLGGYTPVMGFASNEDYDDGEPAAEEGDEQFSTPDHALSAVINEYAEYGHSIHPECFAETA